MSVVPPPMSMTMLPAASVTGRPAPIAAAIGSSTRWTSLALTRKPLSRTARRSTWVISERHADHQARPPTVDLPMALRTKCTSIFSAASKSAITPSRSGRTGADVRRRPAEHLVRLLTDRLDLAPVRC